MKLAKKSLGQNFLVDKNIIRKIINITSIKNKNIVYKLYGSLTDEILKKKPKLISRDVIKRFFFI